MFGEVVLDKVGLRSKEQEEPRATIMNHKYPVLCNTVLLHGFVVEGVKPCFWRARRCIISFKIAPCAAKHDWYYISCIT